MRYFQNHICKFCVFVIALQILNMSIDAPSAEIQSGRSDSFNYMDSFVEYVAEVILKYDNAVPESKDRQQKELQLHKQHQIVCQNIVPLIVPFTLQTDKRNFVNSSDKYAYQFIKEINPPPPKA